MNKTEFKEADNIPKCSYFHVHKSDEWGIALYRVIFGFRVRIWELSNTYSAEADLCFGAEHKNIDLGYRTLLAYLEDGGSAKDIPFQERKPYPTPCQFTDWLDEQIERYPNPKKGEVTLHILRNGLVFSMALLR